MSISRLFALLLLLVLGACASTRGPLPTSAAQASVEVETGGTLKLLERRAAHFYPDARLGTKVGYALPELPWVQFDLFAYRVGVDDDLPGALGKLREGFKSELAAAAAQDVFKASSFHSDGAFEVATHALTASGWRARFDMEMADGPRLGSLVYLFYRPPFALKVRASFPDHAPQASDDAVDAAVRELIPALKVQLPKTACGKIHIAIPAKPEGVSDKQAAPLFASHFAAGMLKAALDGCYDLESALRLTDVICKDQQTLCGNPPWSSKPQ